jgi:hypothetical protein
VHPPPDGDAAKSGENWHRGETDRESGISRDEVPDDRPWHRMVALDDVLIGRSKESKSGVAERERA